MLFSKRPADGHTLLAGNIAPEMMMYVLQEPDFKFPDDFVYFACMDSDPAVLWVRKDGPIQTIQDLVEEGKKRPVTIATSRFPHPSTLAVLLLGEATGAQFNVIPYGGGNPARTAGLTGEVDAVTTFLSSSLDFASDVRFIVMFQNENKWKDISQNAPTPKEALGVQMPEFGATGHGQCRGSSGTRIPPIMRSSWSLSKRPSKIPGSRKNGKKSAWTPSSSSSRTRLKA